MIVLILELLLLALIVACFASRKVPLNVIGDWRGAWKLLTVHVGAVWAIVLGVIVSDPGILVRAWNAIPDELRPALSPWQKGLVAALAVFGSIVVARVAKQPVTRPADQVPQPDDAATAAAELEAKQAPKQ